MARARAKGKEPTAKPKPEPKQPDRRPPAAGTRGKAMRDAVVAAVDGWNPTPPTLSRGGLIRRIARANDPSWKKAAPAVLAALEAAGIPEETAPPTPTQPATAPTAPTGGGTPELSGCAALFERRLARTTRSRTIGLAEGG